MKTAQRNRVPALLSAGLLLWLAGAIVASNSGWLGSLSPMAPPRVAGLTIVISAMIYYLTPQVRAYFAGVGLRRLTWVHVLRIAAVPLFFWYGNRGLLPQRFVESAAWGDLAAGVLALGVVLFWARPAGYWTMHILGMVDFVTAFGTAMRLTAARPDAMHAITSLPIALIPFFGVGVLATNHLIAYDLLLRGRSRQRAGQVSLSSLEAR